MKRLAWLLVATACSTPAVRPPDASPAIDATSARAAALAFVQAMERGDREALLKTVSLLDLTRSARPADLTRTSPVLEADVVDATTERLLDPAGAARRLFTGLTVGEARASGAEAVVDAQSPAASLRLFVGKRAGRLLVVRVE